MSRKSKSLRDRWIRYHRPALSERLRAVMPWLRPAPIALLVLSLLTVTSVLADVTTDKYDYAPGETVYISGDGMAPGETVAVEVTFPDGSLTQHHEVVADDAGNFTDTYALPEDALSGIYTVVATGLTSGNVFTTDFSDARQFTATIAPTSATVGVATSYTLIVTNTSTAGETMDCVRVTIPSGTGTPTSLSVVATDPGPTSRVWNAPAIVSGAIETSRDGGSANSIDVGGTVAISFTATATTSGTKTWTTSAFGNTPCNAQVFSLQSGFSQPSVTVNPRSTSTTVTCSPSSVAVGATTTCTATVDDTEAAGTASNPSGTVSFTAEGPGALSSSTCTLAAIGGDPDSSSCAVTYTPSGVGDGSHNIGASYGGSAVHATSSDTFDVTVTAADSCLGGGQATPTSSGLSFSCFHYHLDGTSTQYDCTDTTKSGGVCTGGTSEASVVVNSTHTYKVHVEVTNSGASSILVKVQGGLTATSGASYSTVTASCGAASINLSKSRSGSGNVVIWNASGVSSTTATGFSLGAGVTCTLEVDITGLAFGSTGQLPLTGSWSAYDQTNGLKTGYTGRLAVAVTP